MIFGVKRSVPENFHQENFWGCYPRNPTQDSENIASLGFGPIAFKQIEHGVPISESMFYSFQAIGPKIKKTLVFGNTAFASRQNSKRGSTSGTIMIEDLV